MKDIISQIKWNSYASAECPTKNGRYLVIMPQFTYDKNISFDINVLTYSVFMDDWCYLWGSSVEENKLPLYWAEIDTKDIVDEFNKKETNTSNNDTNTTNDININENIIDIDAELYVKYMPKSLSVNNHCNIKDIIKIWNSETNLKKYSDLYKYWQDQAVKYLSPIPSNPSLWLFFIECYKAAKEGRDGFFIERVCYSTNIMWRNDFKFKRLIMSWHTGEEDNVDILISKANKIEKKTEKEIDEDLINYLEKLTKLPEDLKLYYNNLRDVCMIWEGEEKNAHSFSEALQNEMKEFDFKCVFADYWEMMRGRNEWYSGKIDDESMNRKIWRFWQSCLKMALNKKCNFRLCETHRECSDGRVIFTYESWSIFWGGYEIMSWKREYDENGKCKIPECAYDLVWVKE